MFDDIFMMHFREDKGLLLETNRELYSQYMLNDNLNPNVVCKTRS